ncbi:MAG: DUF3419 family protein [Hyphomicrobiaceae bacterium]|nr:DUF3419 family protein [Hyphomicrobiaceae bacterium]
MATTGTLKRASARLLDDAVHQSSPMTPEGVRERLFTFAFRGLVYPQIWEDPVIDLEALQVKPTDHMVAIASGGCNILSYLSADPEHITALDLNAAHVALNRLKRCALDTLNDHETFYRFFGEADSRANISVYEEQLRPRLDRETQRYWDGRDLRGRRRITRFARGFYRYGLLGWFIGTGHLAAKLFGVHLRDFLHADDRSAQRDLFERTIAPLFDHRLVQWTLNRPVFLFGLGIPPVQYRALAGNHPGGMSAVIRERLEQLACGEEISKNYFAWQAFGRSYPPIGGGDVPPYLARENFDAIRNRADRIDVRLLSFGDYLESQEDNSLDCYVLLDAQDWMTPDALNTLWKEITRTARPGARVIFRTAARDTLLPGRVDANVLAHWRYEEELSRDLTARDRSAIYGGFHLYVAGRD